MGGCRGCGSQRPEPTGGYNRRNEFGETSDSDRQYRGGEVNSIDDHRSLEA